MANFNSTTRPDNWVYFNTGVRANVFIDDDITGGNVVLPWGRTDGPVVDSFTSGSMVGRTTEQGVPRTWNTWPSGSGSWSISGGSASWSGSGTGVAYIDLVDGTGGARASEITYTATTGTPFLIVHEKGSTSTRTIRCTVGGVLTLGSIVGTTTLTSGQHTVKAVISNVTSTTFDVAMYLDGNLEGSGTVARAGDTSTIWTYGFGVLGSGSAGVTVQSFSVLESASLAATDYEIRNAAGTVVASGSMPADGTSITVADSALEQYAGSGPYGWYHLTTTGTARSSTTDGDRKYHDEYGDCYFSRIPDRAQMPNRPLTTAASTSGNADDNPSHGWLELGPTRIDLAYSDTPSAVLARAAAAETYYVNNQSAARPRYTIGAFPLGAAGHDAEVTAIVTAAKARIKVWSTLNEPGCQTLADAQWFVDNHMRPFYNAVKAGDPDAIVIGPGCVDPSWGRASWFIQAGGLNYIDQFEFHAYNGNRMDIGRARRIYDLLKSTLTTGGYTGPIWQTEQGGLAEFDGLFVPLMAAQDTALQVFHQEINGLTMERNVYWYDISHGFDSYPGWSFGKQNNAALPGVLMMRNMAAELSGSTLDSKFDFGDDADLYLGGVWSKADGTKVVGFMAESDTEASVSFAITGATGTLVTVDPWGNESTVSITNGRFTLTASNMLPVWVRIPSGATVSATATSRGTNYALAASGASITSTGSTNSSYVIDGDHHSIGNVNGYTAPARNVTIPQTWQIDLGSSRDIGRIDLKVIGPTIFHVDTSADASSWTERYAYTHTKAMNRYAGNHRCFWQRYESPQELHTWTGSVTCRYIRLVVTEAMWKEVYIPAFDTEDMANEAYNADTSAWPMAFHVQVPFIRAYAPDAAPPSTSVFLIRSST